MHADAQKASTAIAFDAHTHVLTNDANLVELDIVVDGCDSVRWTVALVRRDDETVHEWSAGDVATVIADSTDDVVVRTSRLPKQQHMR